MNQNYKKSNILFLHHQNQKSSNHQSAHYLDKSNGLNKKRSDQTSSLIRTASFHLKSTVQRFKRSNSINVESNRTRSDICSPLSLECKTTYTKNNPTPKISKNLSKELKNNSSSSDKVGENSNKWSKCLDPPPKPVTSSSALFFNKPKLYTSIIHIPTNANPSQTWTPILNSENHYLPTCEANSIHLLSDECADLGNLGRINFRTGSFMGRYPRARPTFSINNGIDQDKHSPCSFNQNLYLPVQSRTPPTPSPSSSYVLSTIGQDSTSLFKVKMNNVSKQSSTHVANSLLPTTNSIQEFSTSFQLSVAHPTLDPVLDRLILDATSIDEYRLALKTDNNCKKNLKFYYFKYSKQ